MISRSRINLVTSKFNRHSPQARGLLAAWPLNETIGSSHINVVSPNAYQQTSSGVIQRGNGEFGPARRNNAGGYANGSVPVSSSTRPMTISVRIRQESNSGEQFLFGWNGNSVAAADYGVGAYISGNSIVMKGNNAGAPSAVYVGIDSIARWHTVSCVFSQAAGESLIAIDGTIRAFGSTYNNYDYAWGIGAAMSNGVGGYFLGDMADLRIYNRVLTPAELLVIHQRPWELYYASPRRLLYAANIEQAYNLWMNGHQVQQVWAGGHQAQQIWAGGHRIL